MIKILIIEDSKTYSNTLKTFLTSYGFTKTQQAFSLNEATNILKEHEFDFIILDLNLSDGESEELLNKNLIQNSTKIIVLSSNRDIQRRSNLFELGIIDFLSKEIPLKVLIKDIKKVILSYKLNKNKNILLVDDSKFVLKALEDILKLKNYNVLSSDDPIKALELLDTNKIDLIFLDLEMPQLSGIEFLEKTKSQKKYIDLPIIVLSGDNDSNKYARSLKHGAIDFIKKPFLIEEVLLKSDLHITKSDNIKKIAKQAKELQEYKRVLNESDMVSITNPAGIIKYANKKFCEVSGYSEDELLGASHKKVRHPDMPKSLFKKLWSNIKEKKTFKGIIKNKRKDGSSYYVDATISPITDVDGSIKEIIGIRHDITDIMNPKKQLISDLDNMENPVLIFLQLVNYNLFKEFYSETLMHTFEFEFEQVILNYFPQDINLKKVYNLGNGLFAFLKNEKTNEKNIEKDLEVVIQRFKEIGISFKETNFDIDIAIAYSFDDKYILDDVYIGIQYALNYKKHIVFARNLHRRVQIEARNKLKAITLIKDALNNKGKFESFYQGIYNNVNGEIVKYESLIRLINEKNEVISPFHFLDIAKKTGYYINITETVIKNAIDTLKHCDARISINLSSSDLENNTIREALLNLVKKHKGRITFELLEDEEFDDFDSVKNFILRCKKEGDVHIAIDDFGSGYSNYRRLLDFQPDVLKIDGSLIKEIETDSYSRNIVQSIIIFAKSQGIKTVAEFVKDEITYKIVKDLGIDYSQGFYLDEPKRLY